MTDATPITNPGEIQTAGSRWHVRARTLRECTDQLDAIWTSAASDAQDLSYDKLESAMADPRLSGRLDKHGSVRVRMRTSVLTLVVMAPRPETAERAMAVINDLRERHPSRAIVIAPTDPDGPAWMDAHIYAACHLRERSDVEVCTEELLIKAGGELAQHPARVVAPLLIHDLPAVLWWPDDPSFGTRPFREIVGVADRLLVDSGSFAESGTGRMAGLAEVVREGVAVSDIGWLRLSLWRELMAGLYDHPLLTRELDYIRSIRIDVSRPAQTFRLTKAVYYVGWLAAMLGWEVTKPLHEVADGEGMQGTFRGHRHEVKIDIRASRSGHDGTSLSAGSLVRVEIESNRPGHAVRARITRQRDHLLATADWNGAQVNRRAGQLEEFSETPFVAEALERPGLDRIFERSLLRAVHFSGG
jgi:glucose-6-phosphate dehydrogenase assembly protein OpcA